MPYITHICTLCTSSSFANTLNTTWFYSSCIYYMFSGFVCVLQVVLVLRSTRHSMCSETYLEEKIHLPPCLVGLSSVTLDHSEVGCDDLVLYACALCVCVFG